MTNTSLVTHVEVAEVQYAVILPARLVKHRLLDLILRIHDSVGLGGPENLHF